MADALGESRTVPMYAGFNDLPYELHKMIFDVIVDDLLRYKWSWRRRDWIMVQEYFESMAQVNRTWRGLVEEFLYTDMFVQGTRIGTRAFKELYENNTALLGHVKCLFIRAAAGNTYLDATKTFMVGDIGRRTFRKEELEAKAVWNFSADERGDVFFRFWNNLKELFETSSLNKDGDLTLVVKVKNPKMATDPRRQFSFVPREGDYVRELPLIRGVEELRLSTKITGHLELHPKYVRYAIASLPDLMYLTLRVSYLRPLRRFRRDIHRGLTETVQWMLQPSVLQNLQSLTLWCKGSFGMNQDRHDNSKVFSHITPSHDLGDAFCTALRVLSKSLVYFNYEGRISSELFLPLDGDRPDEPPDWPHLREYSVHFDAVDSFGNFLYEVDSWSRGQENWANCECAAWDGEVEDYPTDWHTDRSAAHLPEELHSEDVQEALMCRICRITASTENKTWDKLNKLYIDASQAMLKMPSLEYWRVATADLTASFVYSANYDPQVKVSEWFDVDHRVWDIWRSRFGLGLRHEKLRSTSELSDL